MENLRNLQISHSTLLIFAILCLLPTSIFSANVHNLSAGGEFDYDPCSNRGPEHWGEVKDEWGVCKHGTMQSPIGLTWLSASFDGSLGDLLRNHRPGLAFLKNSGHDISVVWTGDGGSIKVNDADYHLQNFHWHHPSEHTLDGKRYPLELHMVHTNHDPNVIHKIAVVAILYEFLNPDPFLSRLENDIKGLDIDGGIKELGTVDPMEVSIPGRNYYRYMGSLTTPPCSEGVIWTVISEISYVSLQQVELLKHAVGGKNNARPLQKINNRLRDIFYYDPRSSGSAAE